MATLVEPLASTGVDVAGKTGWGVSTPAAAAVAAATSGLRGDVHMPKEAMLTTGFMS